jgi:hypothetical protein
VLLCLQRGARSLLPTLRTHSALRMTVLACARMRPCAHNTYTYCAAFIPPPAIIWPAFITWPAFPPGLHFPPGLPAHAVGLQLRPDLRLDGLSRGLSPAAADAAGGDTASWLRGVTSAAVSYSPAARTRAGEDGSSCGGVMVSLSLCSDCLTSTFASTCAQTCECIHMFVYVCTCARMKHSV